MPLLGRVESLPKLLFHPLPDKHRDCDCALPSSVAAGERRAQARLASPYCGTSFVADVVFHGQRKAKRAFGIVMKM